jgi:D-alanine-D-alanine ligase
VPAALDRLGLRYTGCGAAATERCVSKPAMKRAMAAAGLPTPAWSEDGGRGGELADVPLVIVKSATEHASLGLDAGSIVPGRDAAAAIAARTEAARRSDAPARDAAAGRGDWVARSDAAGGAAFFAETFIDGRELNLSLLETPAGPVVLPPAEIVFDAFPAGRPRIVDYEAKWVEGSFAYRNTPRRFDFPPDDAPLLAALADLAVRTWNLFGLAGYARVDFRIDRDGRPFILEVNTNPCLAPDAGFAAAAERAGFGYDQLIAAVIATAADTARRAA